RPPHRPHRHRVRRIARAPSEHALRALRAPQPCLPFLSSVPAPFRFFFITAFFRVVSERSTCHVLQQSGIFPTVEKSMQFPYQFVTPTRQACACTASHPSIGRVAHPLQKRQRTGDESPARRKPHARG